MSSVGSAGSVGSRSSAGFLLTKQSEPDAPIVVFEKVCLAFDEKVILSNAGGLAIWPARLMMPIGFALLIIQAVSELIKRVAFLRGRIPDPLQKRHERSAEEELAVEIARQRGVEAPVLEKGGEP